MRFFLFALTERACSPPCRVPQSTAERLRGSQCIFGLPSQEANLPGSSTHRNPKPLPREKPPAPHFQPSCASARLPAEAVGESARRVPQAQVHTVPSKSPASAPQKPLSPQIGRANAVPPPLNPPEARLPQSEAALAGKAARARFLRPANPCGNPSRQSISAVPPTAEMLRHFCNASSGFLRMKRTVPAAVPRKHPRTGIRCSAAVQSSGPFGSGSVRETSNSGPHFQASPVKTCPAETPRQQQPHTAAPAHAAPP